MKKRIYYLFDNDRYIKRIFKNTSTLLSGTLISKLVSLGTFIILIRYLSREDFGLFVLIQTYVLFIDQIINFQSWQTVIKFGTEYLLNKQFNKFKSIIKLCFLIDLITAVIGTILGVVFANLLIEIYSIDHNFNPYIIIFSLTILFNLTGVPIAIIRIYDMFKLSAVHEVLKALIQFLFVLLAVFLEMGLIGVITFWALSEIISSIILITFGYVVLNKENMSSFWSSELYHLKRNKNEIMKFLFITNIHSAIKSSTKQLDVFIVGILLSNSAVGALRIAKQISSLVGTFTNPIYHSIYPELSKLWVDKEYNNFKNVLVKVSVFTGLVSFIIWFVFTMLNKWVIGLAFGAEYIEFASLFILYLLGTIILLITTPMSPALLSMGKPGITLSVLITTTIIYIISLFLFIEVIGATGIGLSFITYSIAWTFLILRKYSKTYKNITGDVL